MFFNYKIHSWTILTVLLLLGSHLSAAGESDSVEYRSMESGGIEVLYSGTDSATAALYLGWSLEFIPQPRFLSDRPLKPLRIFIVPSEAEFTRMSGGQLPEWGVAFALPRQDLVIMRSRRLVSRWIEEPRSILNHELSHIFLDQQLRPADIPRWFHEGYAVYSAEMWGLGDMFETSLALAVGAFLPFEHLENSFPQSEARARRAYLQSYTAVDYMFSNWDAAQLTVLFERWRLSGSLDPALRESVGMTLGRFEQNWREWVGLRYGWLKLLGSATLIWIIAAGLFILVFVYRRRRYHRELEKMKRIEARYRAAGPWMAEQGEEEARDDEKPAHKDPRESPPFFDN